MRKLAIGIFTATLLCAALPARANTTAVLMARPGLGAPYAYVPSTVTVVRGDTVVFADTDVQPNPAYPLAMDYEPHTVSSPDGCETIKPGTKCKWSSGVLGPTTMTFTFSLDTSSIAPGTYVYYCKIHPPMKGTLVVTA